MEKFLNFPELLNVFRLNFQEIAAKDNKGGGIFGMKGLNFFGKILPINVVKFYVERRDVFLSTSEVFCLALSVSIFCGLSRFTSDFRGGGICWWKREIRPSDF